ncbi:MAG: hypothetical protein M1815_005393 [Lichina confinis]|nr:MAG: hypothetical protein M1815_005393 [Lichina confinis]
MPAKKRARPNSSVASTVTSRPPTRASSGIISPIKNVPRPTDVLSDPWTDEQEICLFKAIIRWKPAGKKRVHKHFRMIAISHYMHDHGYTPETAPHTNIPGIWRKLRSLYDLETIDDREDAIFEPDDDKADRKKAPFRPFSLPRREYGAKMFAKRFDPDRSSSPSFLDPPGRAVTRTNAKATRQVATATRASTVEDSEEGTRNQGTSTRSRANTRTTRSSVATPQPRTAADTKAAGASKRKRAATRGDDAQQDEVVGTEADAEDDSRRDDSTAAGSTAASTPRTTSKPSKAPPKPKAAKAGTDLRRSSRKK